MCEILTDMREKRQSIKQYMPTLCDVGNNEIQFQTESQPEWEEV